MRFPVGDEFAIRLGEKLYEGVLEDELPLTRAVQLALPEVGDSPLAVATPALFGRSAADLALPVPKDSQGSRGGPFAAGLAYFDPPPEQFMGRVGVMAQASAALAPRSGWTGVLFHGMAGGGKTACALELAYHYEDLERFTGFVWYRAPGEGSEWAGELVRFAQEFETQLSDEHLNPLFPLLHVMAAIEGDFDAYLPRLRQFLEQQSVLLVLDNLETLLRPDGQWREPRWGKLVATLLSHRGESRTVLTSRIRPMIPDLRPEGPRAADPFPEPGRGSPAGAAVAEPGPAAAGRSGGERPGTRAAPPVGAADAGGGAGAPEAAGAGRGAGQRPGNAGRAPGARRGGLGPGTGEWASWAHSSRRAPRRWRPTTSSRPWPAGPRPSPPPCRRRRARCSSSSAAYRTTTGRTGSCKSPGPTYGSAWPFRGRHPMWA